MNKPPKKSQFKAILDEFGISGNIVTILKILTIGLLIYYVWPKPIHHEPGVLVSEEPIQLRTDKEAWQVKDYTIQPLASYSITGRVLSKYFYWEQTKDWRLFEHLADLSGIDLALGWGIMSDENVVSNMGFAQDKRHLMFKQLESSRTLLTYEEMNSHLSNDHLIPANPEIKRKLGNLVEGNVVRLRGYLVEVTSSKLATPWRSSLSRTDTGEGACEIMWVDDVKIIQ